MKDLPKPEQDQKIFTEEFRILLSAQEPGSSDLHQLIYTHVRWSVRC